MTADPVEVTRPFQDLDDPALYERTDPSGMRGRIAALPAQAAEAWRRGCEWPLPAGWRRPERVVLGGMGGSGIGADILVTLAAGRAAVPMRMVRDSEPGHIGADDLVVACSFSGETEETVRAFDAATPAAGMRLALTTGGTLAVHAAQTGAALFRYDDPGPPRTALGWSLLPLLAILSRLDALTLGEDEVAGALAALEHDARALRPDAPQALNPAKQIAARIAGRVPVVMGAGPLEVAARRWAAEIAENAKQWAFALALPEAGHNAIVGFGQPAWTQAQLHALVLDAPAAGEPNRLRARLTDTALGEAGASREVVRVDGERLLEAMMRACYLGDWVSLYLAALNGVDPTPMEPIDRLKARLRGD